MKKLFQKTIILAVMISMALSLGGCSSDTTAVKSTLKEFEYACRKTDLDAMLNCIDPDISGPIRLGLAVYSGATGQDYEDFADSAIAKIVNTVFGENFDSEEFLNNLNITDVKCKAQNEKASVQCKVNFEIAGEKFEQDATIYLYQKDDQWYIYRFEM